MLGQIRRQTNLRNLIFVLSLVLFVWLVWYFYTGFGGPRQLVTRLVPLALLLQILFMYQDDYLYKKLPPLANSLLILLYAGVCVYVFVYFWFEYEEIAMWRQGLYTRHDIIVGFMILVLVMEMSRLAHPILFYVNVVLIFYTLYGYLSPIDFFWHPGATFTRVITSSTVELSTGIYGLYAQIALTLIAAFLLLAAAARGFEAQSAMVSVMRRLAGRSRHTVPLTAVLASVSVGMVSGSGAANTAVTGSFTIPLMKRYGVPPVFAGAVETAASMGGLIMPPLMAVAGFLMAEFMGVPYWEVVMRGFGVAFVYFCSLILAVYLIAVRLLPPTPVATPTVPAYDQLKTAIFFASVLFLITLMGAYGYGALRAALYTAILMFVLLLAAYLLFMFVLKDPLVTGEPVPESVSFTGAMFILALLVTAYIFRDTPWVWGLLAGAAAVAGAMRYTPGLLPKLRMTIETHAEMTSYLTLLLATLGIMIGLFTVTGFILRMGGFLLALGEWHIVALIAMAWVFGWLVGAGLPPTATYIVVAIIIVPPMRQVGIDPWVAHFFAFLLAIWGELSPPTSLTAAVASRIAEASFMRTMFEALKICLPVTFMSFAIFVREDMVVTTGWAQLHDIAIVAIGTTGITFATFGRFVDNYGTNVVLRIVMALVAFVVIFHPDDTYALLASAILLPATIFGVWRHRQVAGPKGELQPQAAQ